MSDPAAESTESAEFTPGPRLDRATAREILGDRWRPMFGYKVSGPWGYNGLTATGVYTPLDSRAVRTVRVDGTRRVECGRSVPRVFLPWALLDARLVQLIERRCEPRGFEVVRVHFWRNLGTVEVGIAPRKSPELQLAPPEPLEDLLLVGVRPGPDDPQVEALSRVRRGTELDTWPPERICRWVEWRRLEDLSLEVNRLFGIETTVEKGVESH